MQGDVFKSELISAAEISVISAGFPQRKKMMFQQVSVAETLFTLHSQIDYACLN